MRAGAAAWVVTLSVLNLAWGLQARRMLSTPGQGWGKDANESCDCGATHIAACDFRLRATVAAATTTTEDLAVLSTKVKRLATPRSSLSDDREYRVVELENGVRAVLVRDPTSDKAAAALAVRVGAYADPWDVPGTAHFAEHMLFQGTTTYPGASEYKKYVASHGGSTNAATSGEATCFQFDVVDDAFEGALDRFGRFFYEPLLDASCVDREMHAVDAEHSKNLNNDGRRAYQMMRLSANPKSAFSKFSTGNLETLNIPGIRDQLVEFHGAHYDAAKMQVSLVSRRPLDDLERLAVDHFGPVKAKKVVVVGDTASSSLSEEEEDNPAMTAPLFEGGAELIERVPVREVRALNMMWPLPFGIRDDYDNGAPRVLSHVLGHEGDRSLLFHLKRLGLANSLTAGFSPSLPHTACIFISIELTPLGDERRDSDVIPAALAYVGALRRETARRDEIAVLWDDLVTVAAAAFDFGLSKRPAYSMAPQLAHSLSSYDPEDILVGGSPGLSHRMKKNGSLSSTAWSDAHQARYEEILDRMGDPTELVVHAARPRSAFPADETFKKERWYGVEYKRRRYDAADLERFRDMASPSSKGGAWTVDDDAKLGMPGPNDFVPRDLVLNDEKLTAAAATVPPSRLIIDKEGTSQHPRIAGWWKRDGTFGQPKAYVSLKLAADLDTMYDATTYGVLMRLLTRCVADMLEAPLYDARCSFLSYDVSATENGAELVVGGFVGRGLDTLWRALLEGFAATTKGCLDDALAFARIKDQLARSFRDAEKARADAHANRWRRELLAEGAATLDATSRAIEAATLDDVRLFQRRFVAASRGVLFAHGKLDEADARRLVAVATETLYNKNDDDDAREEKDLLLWPTPRRVRDLAVGTVIHRGKSPNAAADVDAAVQVCYSAGPREDVAMAARLSLLCQMVRNDFFAQLRTKEQLGYLVSLSQAAIRGRLFLLLSVQSQRATPEHVLNRIDAFVDGFDLASMETTFEATKAATITRLLEPEESMHDEFNKWWSSIEAPDKKADDGGPTWDRYEAMADVLSTTTLAEIQRTFQDVLRNPETTKRLVVQVAGRDHDDTKLDATEALQARDFHPPPPPPAL